MNMEIKLNTILEWFLWKKHPPFFDVESKDGVHNWNWSTLIHKTLTKASFISPFQVVGSLGNWLRILLEGSTITSLSPLRLGFFHQKKKLGKFSEGILQGLGSLQEVNIYHPWETILSFGARPIFRGEPLVLGSVWGFLRILIYLRWLIHFSWLSGEYFNLHICSWFGWILLVERTCYPSSNSLDNDLEGTRLTLVLSSSLIPQSLTTSTQETAGRQGVVGGTKVAGSQWNYIAYIYIYYIISYVC